MTDYYDRTVPISINFNPYFEVHLKLGLAALDMAMSKTCLVQPDGSLCSLHFIFQP
jgi:hypothetical protein